MPSRNKYVAYLVATIILSGGVFYLLSSTTHTPLLRTTSVHGPTTTPPKETASILQNITFSLVVESTHYEISVPANSTVLDAMRAVERSGKFTFSGREYPSLGFFVEEINGKRAANGSYWFLYVNGTSSETGASQTHVRESDTIEWRYEKSH